MRPLLLLAALAAGCDATGFAIDVTVGADPCIAAATNGMAVLVTPNGQGTVTQVIVPPFFGSDGTRRVVVIPQQGTPSVRVDVRAYSDAQRKKEIERASQVFMVEGDQIVEGSLQLACPFEDLGMPLDLAAPDGTALDGGAGDGSDGAVDLRASDGGKDLATKG
jgi:hypothetical protein